MLEADEKHWQALLQGLGPSEELKAASSTAVKTKDIDSKEDAELMEGRSATKFRSLAARLNYISTDRSDMHYAAKDTCTNMSVPTHGSSKRFKKAVRYCACRKYYLPELFPRTLCNRIARSV